jgi:dienelactone hydrolase
MAISPLLDRYETTTFTHDGRTREVYRRGSGPAVIVMTEMPGISPKVLEFADRVVDLGCTAVLPQMFGRAGYDAVADGTLATLRYGISSMVPACISREFATFGSGRTSPIVTWLRALAAAEHERCGGPGVGAIGMCFTGGFALAMAADDRLLAPVLSQPSMPIGIGKRAKYGIDCSREDLDRVKQRCDADGLQVLGLRFRGDRFVPKERFQFLRDELGDGFVAVELDDSAANPAAAMKNPHSVVTEHLIDEPGQPTRAALDQVLDLFRTRLLA